MTTITEQIQTGSRVSYEDMANPRQHGVVTGTVPVRIAGCVIGYDFSIKWDSGRESTSDCRQAGWRIEPATPVEPTFDDRCDAETVVAQVGRMNVLAISGGRVIRRETGITLPVRQGYSVTIDLAWDDTYTVRRMFKRGDKVWIKGELTGVYCEELGEAAYRASCYRDDFGSAAR